MKKPKVRIKKAESFGEGRYVIVSDKDKSFPLFWGDDKECLICADSFDWEIIENDIKKACHKKIDELERELSNYFEPRYDVRVNNGKAELWLNVGNGYIRLPKLITADVHQDPHFAQAGIAEVTITVHANMIKTIDK